MGVDNTYSHFYYRIKQKMNYEIQKITDKVFMENETRKILKELIPQYYAKLHPLLNKKVLKVDNTFMKYLQDEIKDIKPKSQVKPLKPNGYTSVRFYLNKSEYDIYLEIRISFNGGNYEDKTNYNESHEKTKYLCKLDKGIIISFYDFGVDDFGIIDLNQEINTFKKAKLLKEKYEKSLSELKLYDNRKLL